LSYYYAGINPHNPPQEIAEGTVILTV
jgi:hypothetical protein